MCDCAVWLCPQDLVIAATKLRHFEAKRMNSVGDLLKFEHCTRPTIWRKQPQMEHSLEMLLNGTSWLYCMFCCNRKVCASQIFVCPGTWCQICRSVLTCFASLGVGDDGQWSGHGVRRFTRDFDQKCPCRSTIQKWQDVTRCDKYHLADLAQDEVRTAPTASFHVPRLWRHARGLARTPGLRWSRLWDQLVINLLLWYFVTICYNPFQIFQRFVTLRLFEDRYLICRVAKILNLGVTWVFQKVPNHRSKAICVSTTWHDSHVPIFSYFLHFFGHHSAQKLGVKLNLWESFYVFHAL